MNAWRWRPLEASDAPQRCFGWGSQPFGHAPATFVRETRVGEGHAWFLDLAHCERCLRERLAP